MADGTSQDILARTLAAYHGLIAAIEAARQISDEDKDHELTVYLSTHFNLDAASFPKDCFARSFLTAARRPSGPKRIRFIAPGIELPSTISIRDQPFKAVAKKYRFASGVPGLPSVDCEEGSDPLYPPFLLFPGEGTKAREDKAIFEAPFDELEECPVGLWVDRAEPRGEKRGEDEAVVVVPFESWRSFSPCDEGIRLPLFTVLEEWTEMVSNGSWDVDERGVMGSIELLRQEDCDIDELRGRSRVRGTKGST